MRRQAQKCAGPGDTDTSRLQGAAPYAARLWQFPIDENRTLIQRFLTWRARTPEERERGRGRVNSSSGLTSDFLFGPDVDVVRTRRHLKDAFLEQREGKRLPIPNGALVYPC